MHIFSRRLFNKAPKILLLIVVLYALSLNKGLLFGHNDQPSTPNRPTDFGMVMVNDFFNSETVLSTADSVLYEVRFAASDNDPSGYMIVGREKTNSHRGYGSKVPIAIFLDQGMIVRGVKILANNETRRFIKQLENGHFFERWNGQHLYDQLQHVDAFSGATYTSQAVISNVTNTLTELLNRKLPPLSWNTFTTNYLGEFAILLIIIMSLSCFISPHSTRKLRIPLLILSVCVLGIWQGAFVSLDLLYKWFVFGTSPLVRFGIFTMVILSLLMPLFINKAFYCTYFCPFGASQELLGRLWPRKWAIPKRVLKIARWIRQAILVTIVILLLTMPHLELANIEPFTVFLIKAASVSALVIAGVSLLASLFIQRPWCRLLCPTGELLAILRRPIRYPKFISRKRKSSKKIPIKRY